MIGGCALNHGSLKRSMHVGKVHVQWLWTGCDTDHNEKLLWVHSRLKAEWLFISCKKFELLALVLDILGCKGVHANSDKMSKVQNWHEPTDHREVLHFLGLVEYLAHFMPNVSAYMGPLETICTNNLPFRWTPLHQKCFDGIKALACKAPILKPIQWDIPKGLTDSEFKK